MSEQTFNTPNPVRLDVQLSVGDVEVTTADRQESTIVADGSQKALDAIEIGLEGNRLRITEQRKGLFNLILGNNDSVSLKVQIPHHSRVEIGTAAADATLDGHFERVVYKSASGDLRLSGEVDGDVETKTVSGDVRLGHVAGSLNVNTVSGDCVTESADGPVVVKSISGDLRVGGLREGAVNVNSVSGDVELGILPGSNVDVDASSASGHLSSEVPLSGSPSEVDGGPSVIIRGSTVSGDFRVVRSL
jgi:DUF4097 and DUF4098 domain-containing protein YvlB